MSYNKQEFRDGEILTADHLNHIEQGIVENENNIFDGINTRTLGKIFSQFPTEDELSKLENKSYFTVKSTGWNTDIEMATYFKTSEWRRNGIKHVNSYDNTSFYVIPVSQPVGLVYVPYYGIKQGEEYAESNSEIMDSLIENLAYGATLKFPVGHFYFNKPIDVSSKHSSILGTTNASFKNIDLTGTTFLHFPNLAEGETALTVAQCTISDFTVFGTEEQYSLTLNRDNATVDVNTVVQETISVKAYGIKASGCMNIRNIGFRYFYYGCWCKTGNMAISNVTFHNCHYGLSVEHDIKIYNIFGWEVMILLQMRGSIASAIGVRGDSIGDHLVEITGGQSHTLVDLDADFCMNAIVAIGDGVNSSNIKNLSITGVHGRAGVSHLNSIEDNEISALDVNSTNSSQFGIITIESGSTLKGAIITVNQGVRGDVNPFDKIDGYTVPFVLLTSNVNTKISGVQIYSTSYLGDEITSDWVEKRIACCSTLPDACAIKIYTQSGSIMYCKSNGVITITDDATDIYNRMDKSLLAMNAEVVKTVNGMYPDDEGNVMIIEQEPEVVQGIEECIDTTKRYVLPDGYIYAYRKRFIPGATNPNFINQLPLSIDPLTKEGILNETGHIDNAYFTFSSTTNAFEKTEFTKYQGYSTGLIPVQKGDTIRINAIGYAYASGEKPHIINFISNTNNRIRSFSGEPYGAGNSLEGIIKNSGGNCATTGVSTQAVISEIEFDIDDTVLDWTASSWANGGYMWVYSLNTTPPENLIITINEEITYTITEDRYEWSWENTGELYVKPDYLGMINELQSQVEELTNRVNALES